MKKDIKKILIGVMFQAAPFILPAIALAVDDPGTAFLTLATNWIGGNLGKFVAIATATGGAVAYAATHQVNKIIHGLAAGALVGGAVGLGTKMHAIGLSITW